MQIDKPVHRWQLNFQGDWPTSVCFLEDGRLAAGNRSGQIFVWQLPEPGAAEGETAADSDKAVPSKAETKTQNDAPRDLPPIRRLDGHSNGITQLRVATDGVLLSSSLDHSICLWESTAEPTGTASVVLDSRTREEEARRLPNDKRDDFLNAPGVDVETVGPAHRFEEHHGWVFAMDVTPDGRRMISGDDQCLAIVWDLSVRKSITQWKGYDRVWVRSAAISPDGETVFTCEFAGRRSNFDAPAAQARLWQASDGSLIRDLLKIWTPETKDEDRKDTYGYWTAWSKLLKRGLVSACFSGDGKLLAVGQGGETDTGKVHLVDVESGKILRTVSGHKTGVCDVKFSADGKYVLSSGRDTTVKICQVTDGKEVATLGKERGGQFKDWMHAIAISPDQRFVAAADIAGYIHVWQLTS